MDLQDKATDYHQTENWAQYMRSIGWSVEKIENTFVYIYRVPLIHKSLIKIIRPRHTLNFGRLDELAKKHDAVRITIDPTNTHYNEQDYIQNNYKKIKPRIYTKILLKDLTPSKEELLKTFSRTARTAIYHTQQNNLQIHIKEAPAVTEDEFNQFYTLYKDLGRRKKFYTLSYKECLQRFEAFKNNAVFIFAQTQQSPQPVAASWFNYCEKTMIYTFIGIAQEGYAVHANYRIIYEAMCAAKDKGCEVFDLEAVYDERLPRKEWKGLTTFKEHFHGQPAAFPESWSKTYSILGHLFT
jgi:lipid II:glycine glycyltransferase (peptidoglycan interpeptide bridge formation enzyme)